MRYYWMALPMALTASAASAHICWIEQVVTEGAGVRVFYDRGGMGGGYGPYESDFIDAGKSLSVSRTPHGACTLTVTKENGRIGVSAHAAERIPGIAKADTKQERIEAVPPAPPYIQRPKVDLAPVGSSE